MAAAMTLEAETSDALAVQRCPMTHGGSPQAASRRAAHPALTPNAVSSLSLLNSILLNSIVSTPLAASRASSSVCVSSRPFSCVAFRPSVLLSDAAAIALDRRKDQIDVRGHRDGGKHLRLNPGPNADTRVYHLNASTVFTSTSNRARDLLTAREICLVDSALTGASSG
jgi:hypothetical protein